MKKSNLHLRIMLILLALGFSSITCAQVDFSVNSFQRAEFNNGFGQLIGDNQDPIGFIGQRFRIQADYRTDNVRFFASVQDIRVWGAVPTTKLADGFLSMHEAFTEIDIHKRWQIKLGRQELNYDNARFLGNLDWAFQARAHDAVLLRYSKESNKLDLGFAYNQNTMNLFAQPFLVPGHYRAAQFARYENEFKNLKFAVLFWNNGVEQVNYNDLGEVEQMSIRYAQTIGIPKLIYKIKEVEFSGFYYHQLGRDGQNNRVDAFDLSAHFQWKRAVKGNSNGFTATLGFEILSGTSNTDETGVNRSFDPMYGTNHIHNGYLDYFFVAGRANDGLGLQDFFAKFKYDFSSSFFTSINVHQFATAADFYDQNGDKMDDFLGTEIDLTIGKIFNPSLSIQLGYSHLFATNTLERIQANINPSGIQQWGYVMLIYRPKMKNRFVGLLF
ncbi:MAG: alginate export family protein [Cryomorphaceae bacterium]|nr:alginate export family protein [Cryomorphaceae bacterium]